MQRQTTFGVLLFLWILCLSGCSLWRLQAPAISLIGLEIIDGSLFEQRFALTLRVQNPNLVDLPIQGIRVELFLNDQPFAKGESDQPVTLPGMGEAAMQMTAATDLAGWIRQIPEWRHRQPALTYLIKGHLVTDAIKDLDFEKRGAIELPVYSRGKP